MSLIELIGISVVLALDAVTVSIGAAAGGYARSRWTPIRVALCFGLFQGGMAFIGWLLGAQLESFIGRWDHWVAFGLLTFVAVRMVRSGLDPRSESRNDPTRGPTLLLLAVATSIDALAVGVSFGMLDVVVFWPCVIIGVITAILSYLGVRLGGLLGVRYGNRMEIAGGLLLFLIGVRILVTHLPA